MNEVAFGPRRLGRTHAEAWSDAATALSKVGLSKESETHPYDLPAAKRKLVGLAAVSAEGEALGEVVRVEHAPASDLLVLRRPGGRTALVPFVKAIVPEVDVAGRRVVLTPPEGLFDL